MACITFTNKDHQLRFKNHNKPLYVTDIIEVVDKTNPIPLWFSNQCPIVKGVKSDKDNTKLVVQTFLII